MKRKTRKILEKKWKRIAKERIAILEKMKKIKPEFAQRYDELIYLIKKKCRLLPKR